jgi:transposase-like protein
MKKRAMKRYSEAFKHEVVSEYEGGQSVLSLRKRYGINGNGTVERWVRKYGHTGFRTELVVIQRAEERDREKLLEKRIKELESAVAQLTLEKIVLASSLEEAEKLLGTEVKKNDVRPSSEDASSTR